MEEIIRAHHAGGDLEKATTRTLEAYGSEIYSLLVALHRDGTQADDAFSLFSERLWLSMTAFEFRCSMRTWAYRLARAASIDVRRGAGRHANRHTQLSGTISKLVVRLRSDTKTYLRTETKSEVRKLRETLDPEEQLILVLRIDRQLPWGDIARIFLNDDEDAANRKTEAARIRKRYQVTKDRLKRLARERGLL